MSIFRFGLDDLDLMPRHPQAEVVAFPLSEVRGNRVRAVAMARKIAEILPDTGAAAELWVAHIQKIRAALTERGLPRSSIDKAIAEYTATMRVMIADERARRPGKGPAA